MERVFLCDVDGVLADFLGAVLEGVHGKTGVAHSRQEVTQWSIADSIGVPKELIARIACEKGFCRELKVLPGARELVDMLRKYGEVYFVTSPFWSSQYWMYERNHWLWREFEADSNEIVHTSAKHLIRGDMLIDDKPSTVEMWAMSQPVTDPPVPPAVLWYQLYNQGFVQDPRLNVVTARSWEDVETIIRRMP